MDKIDKTLFGFIFKTFCLIGAIVSAGWCCYEFSKNEDICDVYFKRFLEDEESVYPEMTIVVPQQFNESKLKTIFGENMTSQRLRKILVGEDWDDIYQPCYE